MSTDQTRIARWCHRLLAAIAGLMPVSTRWHHQQLERLENELTERHRHAVRTLSQRHQQEQEQLTEKVAAIIRRASDIHFRFNEGGPLLGERYSVMIQFDPRLMQLGGHGRDHLKLMAQIVAREVEAEIASSRFIQSAHDGKRDLEEFKRGRRR